MAVGTDAPGGDAAAVNSAAPRRIAGRQVTFPVEVRAASSLAITYLVPTSVARSLMPCPELLPVEVAPGKALFSLACIDYRDNDLGDYNEVSFAFFVRQASSPRGIPYISSLLNLARSRASTWIQWLPVNQKFTCEAGRSIWGFPKTVETINFTHRGGQAACTLSGKDGDVLDLKAPYEESRSLPRSTTTTWTMIDGSLHAVAFESEASRVGVSRSEVQLELGNHPQADLLRELGLPKPPLFTAWLGWMKASFPPPSIPG